MTEFDLKKPICWQKIEFLKVLILKITEFDLKIQTFDFKKDFFDLKHQNFDKNWLSF